MKDRGQETRERIHQAIIRVANSGSLRQNMTATSVTRAAGIGRSTFYMYYDNLQDALDELAVEYAKKLIDRFFVDRKKYGGFPGYADAYRQIIAFIYENQGLFRMLLENDYFQKVFEEYATDLLVEHYKELLPGRPEDVLRYSAVGAIGFVEALLREWARSNFARSPDEMAELFAEALKINAASILAL